MPDGRAATPPVTSDIDPAVLREAAEWLVLLQSGEATERDHAELERWRHRSSGHQAAWARAEDMLGMFRQVPPQLGRNTLSRVEDAGRRRLLRLGLSALVLPAAWTAWKQTPWREWNADLRTATGERRAIDLADGTRVVLDTASAVDVVFTTAERHLILRAGEILVATGHDPSPSPRPFFVDTTQGSLRALGTRFSVRSANDGIRAAVSEGAVEIRPAHSSQVLILRSGQRTVFTAGAIGPAWAVETEADLWERRMLLVRRMPLGDLVAELARYHRGILRCDPSVADMVVSGAFPVMDTEASLDLLQKTLPLRIGRVSSYWITVRPR